ncbi:solute carrier 46 [Steccherinum ochraceum]|uniref:Solute carrier 46 n=1 Tax=Steccherinum ochraceum TaxID=92696 RepID=A0A4R0RSQ5_9APHY|nr:solute carrier 46 [Steccherinum ochraceum]
MSEPTTQPRPSGPGFLLLFVFVQSVAAGLSVLGTVELFHKIRHDDCLQTVPIHIPETYPCDNLPGYGPSVMVYYSVVAVLTVLVAGPYARLMDGKGRETVTMMMAASGLFNACGDIWLYLCASVPQLNSTIYPAMISAVFKGLGGASMITQAAHWSLMATSTSPNRRSTFMSLVLFITWVGSGVSLAGSAALAPLENKALTPMLAFWGWTIYSLAVAGLLHKEADPVPSVLVRPTEDGPKPFPIGVGSIWAPVSLLFKDSTTGLITATYAMAVVALNAFDCLLAVGSDLPGFDGAKNTLALMTLPTLRCLIVLSLVPAFVTIYQWRRKEQPVEIKQSQDEPSEADALLADTDADTPAPKQPTSEQPTSPPPDGWGRAWKQDLLITRWGFLIGGAGVLFTSFSKSLEWYIAGSSLTALIVPAAVATTSIATMHAHPSELSRTMMGFALIDSVAMLLRLIPTVLASNDVNVMLPARPILMVVVFAMIGGSLVPRFIRRDVKSD